MTVPYQLRPPMAVPEEPKPGQPVAKADHSHTSILIGCLVAIILLLLGVIFLILWRQYWKKILGKVREVMGSTGRNWASGHLSQQPKLCEGGGVNWEELGTRTCGSIAQALGGWWGHLGGTGHLDMWVNSPSSGRVVGSPGRNWAPGYVGQQPKLWEGGGVTWEELGTWTCGSTAQALGAWWGQLGGTGHPDIWVKISGSGRVVGSTGRNWAPRRQVHLRVPSTGPAAAIGRRAAGAALGAG